LAREAAAFTAWVEMSEPSVGTRMLRYMIGVLGWLGGEAALAAPKPVWRAMENAP
jgi:hypothetical protein